MGSCDTGNFPIDFRMMCGYTRFMRTKQRITRLAGRSGIPTDPDHPITRRRLDRGWTQGELAARAGCHLRTISQIERGAQRRPPTQQTIDALARVFRLDPLELSIELMRHKAHNPR